MFFNFISENEYPPSRWILVWEAEKALQALILAEDDLIRRESNHEIIAAVLDIIRAYDSSRKSLFDDDAVSFVCDFLKINLPSVKCFMEDLCKNRPTKEVIKTQLMPNSRLLLCIQQNDKFREHILRGKGAVSEK